MQPEPQLWQRHIPNSLRQARDQIHVPVLPRCHQTKFLVIWGVPSVVQWNQRCIHNVRMQVQSQAWHSGLKDPGRNCGSDLIPSPRNSISCRQELNVINIKITFAAGHTIHHHQETTYVNLPFFCCC